MGIGNLIKSIGGLINVKADKAADAIVDSDLAGHSEQAIKELKSEIGVVVSNLGEIKSNLKLAENKKRDQEQELDEIVSKIKRLIEDGSPKAMGVVEQLDKSADSLKELIGQSEYLINELQGQHDVQEKNMTKLKANLREAESDVTMIKTMQQVTKSQEALNEVNLDGAANAAGKLKDYKERALKKQAKATAIGELSVDASKSALDEADDILGTTPKSADDFKNKYA